MLPESVMFLAYSALDMPESRFYPGALHRRSKYSTFSDIIKCKTFRKYLYTKSFMLFIDLKKSEFTIFSTIKMAANYAKNRMGRRFGCRFSTSRLLKF